ncbi:MULTISPECIES: molybdopterin-dependent aldehyde oxidoreductase [Pelosinus]|uniref:Aldehyde oxidase and xanthine dehydrogenase molybdopterin binding protein n=1 Tax=Pelosinus fermentans B4 TaxID=1149862 RepID=I9B541_9FIRM|nr:MULTISPECIES: molybdopterin-dependent aldehyde oxidoreductase [Pelosinus]EIW20262.1 aldehyde oxidase and xanthine dehydrogenase molybdopterin binding protein [Pelosinus fermentans B4]EIW25900.1 aldehyde oxidase and xanthine dehydrogenase molybdopterin binding protein [Pelosinus fermentans A11]OAM93198.1 Aldehyde dehydrogenase (FAD-independent) [Pelosinus fermentans DSM 17108]SDQ70040.1 aldehyde dehydrogenase, molybdenum-binding subunit apoprotein [Pelosinus fermentans]
MQKKVLHVNGLPRVLIVNPETSLASVLREQLLLTGCKVGCNQGQCGTCSIIMDGKVVRSCIVKMKRVPDEANITTIEGLAKPENLHPLQVAWMAYGCAQCGFCSPGFILSAKVLLDTNSAPKREDVREWFQKNRNACRCTGYKPLVDAVMAAAKVMRGEMHKEDLLYKPVGNKIYGTTYHRPSALRKVTGTWDYGADVALQMPPGTLRMALVQAEVSHANIMGIDTAEAENMPGVYKVITHKDVKGKNRITGLITFPTNKGDGWDRPILCDEKVFQFGDAIAIICADTEEHAKAAAQKVKVDLEILPSYMSAPAAMAADAIEIHPGVPNIYFEQGIIKGEDTEPIMKQSDVVTVEVDTYCSRQPHLPLEPDCGCAYFDEEGRLTIHSKSIGLHLHHAMIVAGIGIEPEKCRIVQNPAGGTFGYKFSPTIEALLGVACMATGKPVSLNFTMYQNITYTGKRSPGFVKCKLAADKTGKLLAMETDWFIDHGPYSEFGDLLTLRQAQFTGAGYDIPRIRGKGRTVCTNHAWGSAFRGYGSPQAFLASEIAMDELAEKLGLDPLELRFKNIYRPGATTPTGQVPEVFCFEDMINTLRPLWEEAKKRCKELSTSEKKRGVGLSLGIYGCGLDGPDSSEAWVELTKNGITVGDSWQDHGQGADIGTLSHAHETLRPLGIKAEQIKLVMNDTAFTPNSGPSGGSRSNVMTGNAIKVACEMLLNAMRKPDGTYRSYDEMAAENLPLHYNGKWTASMCTDCDPVTGQGKPFPIYMYELFMPEVEVDMKTGKAKVVKFTTVADMGTITNKTACDGQIYGGLAQGIGLALTEDFEDLKKHTNLVNCGLPFIYDVPDDIQIIYNITPREHGPHGAAGAGEGPLSAPHPGILNAIYNACGVRIYAIPALPEKIKAGLAALSTRDK